MTGDAPPLDQFTGEALLNGTGRLAGDPLSDILDALDSPALSSELATGTANVQAMVAALDATAAAGVLRNRRRLTTRTVALAAAGTLLFSGVAAATVGVPIPVVGGLIGPDDTPELVDTGESEEDRGQRPASQSTSEELTEADEGPGNSDRARSDCGKPDAEPSDDPECEEAENHGAYVSGQTPGNSDRARSDCGKPDAEPSDDPGCEEAENHGEYVSSGPSQANPGSGTDNSKPADVGKPADAGNPTPKGQSNKD